MLDSADDLERRPFLHRWASERAKKALDAGVLDVGMMLRTAYVLPPGGDRLKPMDRQDCWLRREPSKNKRFERPPVAAQNASLLP